MKVLLVEDMGSIFESLNDEFIKKGYEVLNAYQASDALDIIAAEDNIDVFIVDLMISSVGFSSDEDIKLSQGGHLSGWTLIKNYILPKFQGKSSIIIYSGYTNYLDIHVPKYELSGIKVFNKNDFSPNELIELL